MGQRFDRRGKRTDEMLESDEGAVGAGLDGVRRRVLLDAAAGDGAHAAADTDLRRRASAISRCAARPATTAGSAT